MNINILILSLPFLQIGFSYFASIGTLSAFLSILIVKKRRLSETQSKEFIGVFLAIIIISISRLNDPNFVDEFFRILREMIVFFIILAYGRVGLDRQSEQDVRFLRTLFVISSLLTALCLVQLFFIQENIYFGLPQEWFSRNAGSLPSLKDFIYSDVRPMGTYGEPSYLSYVMFSFMVIVSPLIMKKNKISNSVFFIALLCVLLTRSGLGFLFSGALTGYLLMKKDFWAGLLTLIATIVILVIFSNYIYVFDRFSEITVHGSEKSSGYFRVFLPLIILPEFLTTHPLGMTLTGDNLSAFVEGYPVRWYSIIDNGLLNLVFSYGLVGVVMLAYLFFKYSRSVVMLLFIAFTLLQNGDPWSLDKLAVVLITTHLFSYCSAEARKRRKSIW